jgi:hypothetical protein
MGTGSFPGVNSGQDVTLTPHHRLAPWSRESRAIPLLSLRTVRPLQSLSACTRVNFTFYLIFSSVSFESTTTTGTSNPTSHTPLPNTRLPHVNTIPPMSKPHLWFLYHYPSHIINHVLCCCRCTIAGTEFIMTSFVKRLVIGLSYRRYGFSPIAFRVKKLCNKKGHRGRICSEYFPSNCQNHLTSAAH